MSDAAPKPRNAILCWFEKPERLAIATGAVMMALGWVLLGTRTGMIGSAERFATLLLIYAGGSALPVILSWGVMAQNLEIDRARRWIYAAWQGVWFGLWMAVLGGFGQPGGAFLLTFLGAGAAYALLTRVVQRPSVGSFTWDILKPHYGTGTRPWLLPLGVVLAVVLVVLATGRADLGGLVTATGLVLARPAYDRLFAKPKLASWLLLLTQLGALALAAGLLER